MKDLSVEKESARFLALQECEHRIVSGYRRGLEATCAIAKEFLKINKEKLYEERGCETFSDYVQTYLQLSWRSTTRILAVARAVEVLRTAGLRLPANQSQVEELTRLDEAKQPEVWQLLLKAEEMEEVPLTASAIEKAVDLALQARVPERRGVQTPLDIDDSGGKDGDGKK